MSFVIDQAAHSPSGSCLSLTSLSLTTSCPGLRHQWADVPLLPGVQVHCVLGCDRGKLQGEVEGFREVIGGPFIDLFPFSFFHFSWAALGEGSKRNSGKLSFQGTLK